MLWLVTGASGFLGRHVVETLTSGLEGHQRADVNLILMGRRQPEGWPEERFVAADLNDPAALRQGLQRFAPDYVIHTAGRTPPAEDDELYRANFWATTHLLAALRSLKKPCRVVLSGSAAELGPVASCICRSARTITVTRLTPTADPSIWRRSEDFPNGRLWKS